MQPWRWQLWEAMQQTPVVPQGLPGAAEHVCAALDDGSAAPGKPCGVSRQTVRTRWRRPLMPILAVVAAFLWVLCVPGASWAAPTAKAPAGQPRGRTPLVIAGWIPSWNNARGLPEALAHLPQLSEVSPFAYEVKEDGTLRESLRLDAAPWADLVMAARRRKVKIIPTIAWARGHAIHAILAVPALRHTHVQAIVALTTRYNVDGVDIDYEAKRLASKAAFAQFIHDLSTALHAQRKRLVCTIEPRTPPSALSPLPPKPREDVNDYEVLNRSCDTVRIMTYDQSTGDLDLNALKGTNQRYAPVADVDWVHKVITLAHKRLPPRKSCWGSPPMATNICTIPRMPRSPGANSAPSAMPRRCGWRRPRARCPHAIMPAN